MAFDFENDVIERSKTIPVLLELGLSNCGPCYFMEKTMVDAVKRNDKVEFVSLPIDQYPDLADRYNIQTNPTTLFIKNGKEVARLKGAFPLIVVEQWINDHI